MILSSSKLWWCVTLRICRGWGTSSAPKANSKSGSLLSRAPDVLHDMAITIAEAVAAAYLAEASQGLSGRLRFSAVTVI